MSIFLEVIKKELLQLLRNPLLLLIVICCPVIILGIVPHAMGNEPHIRLIWIDRDDSPASRRIGHLLSLSSHFSKITTTQTLEQALSTLEKGKADMILQIPANFGKQEALNVPPSLFIAVDGTHTISTQNYLYYLQQTLRPAASGYDLQVYPLFNESSDNRNFYLVSLLVLLMTILGISLVTLNVVIEKGNGVFEQLRATAMNWHVYIGGKITFFVMLCLLELLLALLICRISYGFGVGDNLFDFMVIACFFQLTTVGLGLLIASLTKTPLQAAYLTIFLLLTLVLLSTMFSQLHSMPAWGQALRFINPLFMMLDASRLVALKGFTLQQVVPQLLWLALQGSSLILLAGWRLKRL